MAEKEQQIGQPEAHRSDEEAAGVQSKELRRKKSMKCFIYIIAFAIFQIGIITLFSLTVMKIRNPKFRVRSASFEPLDFQNSTPSINMRINFELGVKNTNFGHFKFENSPINFFYKGAQIGSATVLKARARARSTKKINVVVDLSSSNLPSNSGLGNDLNSGILPLSSESRLRGKIHLFKVFKKKKSTEMNCTMDINIPTRELRNVICK